MSPSKGRFYFVSFGKICDCRTKQNSILMPLFIGVSVQCMYFDAMTEKHVEDAAIAAAQKLGFKEIKPLQLEVIRDTAEGNV